MRKSVYQVPLLIFIILYFFNTLYAGLSAKDNLNAPTTQKVCTSESDYAPNVIVVKFAHDFNFGKKAMTSGNASIDKLLNKHRVNSLQRFIQSERQWQKSKYLKNVYLLYYSGSENPQVVAREFSKNENIIYAEPQRKHYSLLATPNDPSYNLQEGYYKKIEAPKAWDVVKGESGNVVIAVVDGGTDIDHPDLEANLWENPDEIPNNGVDDDGNSLIDDVYGWNFANNSNDPTGLSGTPINANHGTHTAGIYGAVTNNSAGVAGSSWNARIMAINAGCPEEDNCIASLYGYSGILYAADQGADIINCSWGGLGNPLQLEQDVINEATSLGAVVVCAAGNDNSSAAHYPSSYDNAFSVAATDIFDQKAGFSNYGRYVDVAAPGVTIYSTNQNNQYGYSSGTSMSAPMTAGVIGLVKTLHPDWLNVQAAEQVRVTADALPLWEGKLGKGRINAYRAVTESSPSIRITEVNFIDGGGDGIINAGETVQVQLKLLNYLTEASNVDLILSEQTRYVTMETDNIIVPVIGTMQEVSLPSPFIFKVEPDAIAGLNVTFSLNISSGNYQDLDRFILRIRPTFETVNINNVEVTVTNIGRIGYANPHDETDGIGFKYEDGSNLLFEGALILGTAVNQISSASRGLLVDTDITYDLDFNVSEYGDLKVFTPGANSAQETKGIFEDTAAVNPMNIRITQETYALTEPDKDDFIILKYKVKNLGTSTLNNLHLGLFLDWDIFPVTTNLVGYDATRKLGYCYDTEGFVATYAGISLVSDGTVSYRAIYNDQDEPINPSWGLYDGFTKAEKWQAISGGTTYTTAGPQDVSMVIATGPLTLNAQETKAVGFTLLAAQNLSNLQVHADAAKAFWDEVVVTDIEDNQKVNFPNRYALQQNYPNPFNPATNIKFDVKNAGRVKIDIYNTLGQKVRTLVDDVKSAGKYSVVWNGLNDFGDRVASGIYIYKMVSGDFVQTRKMILLR